MSDFYDDFASDAIELLEEFGSRTNVCLRSRNAASYDEIKNEYANEVESDIALLAVVVGYSDSLVDGSRVKKSDRKVICSCEVEPDYEDTMIIAGVEHSIESIKSIAPIGEAIIYIVQARS